MALERVWYLKTRSQDKTIAIFADATVYGTPEADRNDEAHFIAIAKADENQNLAFISDIDNSDPLNALEYQITQSADGHYRLFSFNPPFYNGATEYTKQIETDGVVSVYGDIVWHPGSATWYKAIGTAFTAIEPSVTASWEDYWTATIDWTLEVSNNKTNVYIHDDIITFRFEDCFVTELDEVNDDILCNVCNKFEDMFKVLSMQLMLDGANSNNWQGKQSKSEVILQEANKRFCC
jgi:hypothetical protein